MHISEQLYQQISFTNANNSYLFYWRWTTNYHWHWSLLFYHPHPFRFHWLLLLWSAVPSCSAVLPKSRPRSTAKALLPKTSKIWMVLPISLILQLTMSHLLQSDSFLLNSIPPHMHPTAWVWLIRDFSLLLHMVPSLVFHAKLLTFFHLCSCQRISKPAKEDLQLYSFFLEKLCIRLSFLSSYLYLKELFCIIINVLQAFLLIPPVDCMVLQRSNNNLSPTQKELLLWHYHLDHLNLQHV